MNTKLLIALNMFFGSAFLVVSLILLFGHDPINPGAKTQQLNSNLAEKQILAELSKLSNDLQLLQNKAQLADGGADQNLMTEIAAIKTQLSQVIRDENTDKEEQAVEKAQLTAAEIEQQHLDAIEAKKRYEAEFVQKFENQPVDEFWSADTASKIDQVLLDSQLNSWGISTPDCRSDMCKLDIEFGQEQDQNEETEFLLLTKMSDILPRAKAIKSADGTVSFYFMSRPDRPSQHAQQFSQNLN